MKITISQKIIAGFLIVTLLGFVLGVSSLTLTIKLTALIAALIFVLFTSYLISKNIVSKNELEKEIKKIDEIKSSTIRDVSHEFRNNISFIFNAVSLLKDEIESPKTNKKKIKEYFDTINRYSEMFEGQISSILQLGMLERTENIQKSKVNVSNIIFDVKEEFDERAKEKKLKIKTKVEGVPSIWANHDLIRTLIRNLVSNAIKFTDKGYVEVVCKRKDKNVLISVEDTGIGIKKEDIGKLFRAYSRLDSLKEGIGVGLTICKKVVNLHNGSIKIESKIGKGTKFIVMIPVKASDA